MEQKIQKMFFVFHMTAFELGVLNMILAIGSQSVSKQQKDFP